MKFDIKKLYLYSATLIGLIVTIIGAVQLVDLGLKVFIFKDIDRYPIVAPYYEPGGQKYSEEEMSKMKAEQEAQQEVEVARQKKRQASTAISMLAVSIPVYLYHWRLVNKKKS